MFPTQAAFANPKPEDRGRLFVLVYYSNEFALMIREPPRRNSGVVGGNFLAKMKLKHPDGRLVTAADLVIGATLTLASHTFVILDADEATLKYMENRPGQFPYSDRDAVVKLFKGFVNRVWLTDRDRRAAFDAISTHKTISFEELQLVLETVVPFDAKTSPPKQAVIILWRNYAKAGKLHVQDLPF